VASVFDIAAHIRARIGDQGRMKLNKLAFYVQAWSLVWRERPAFGERIEAWKDGPVVVDLWASQNHRDSAEIYSAKPLSTEDAALVDRVLVAYGHLTGEELSVLTHAELPWKNARGATAPGAKSSAEITHDAMMKFYGHRWIEAERDNASAVAPPAFTGSVAEFLKQLDDQ
jgi:uncharacterized phage-associated protein